MRIPITSKDETENKYMYVYLDTKQRLSKYVVYFLRNLENSQADLLNNKVIFKRPAANKFKKYVSPPMILQNACGC